MMKKNPTVDRAPEKMKDLFHLMQQREAELSVINSVQEAIVNGMGMAEIYNMVGDRIQELFDSESVAISIFDYENQLEYFKYYFEDGQKFEIDSRQMDKIRQHLINTREVLYLNENVDEQWTKITGEEPTVVPGTKLTQSALFVPMVIGDFVMGYISLQNIDRENAFSESDIRMLSTLTKSMSVGLENARLFNETEQRNAELAVINSVQEGLVAEMDMQGIYELVGNRIRDLFDSQVTAIEFFNTSTGMMYGHRSSISVWHGIRNVFHPGLFYRDENNGLAFMFVNSLKEVTGGIVKRS